MRTLTVVHNNVDQSSSIGKLAAWAVDIGLSAGLAVTVVARDLDPALRAHVSWRPLYVPPRLHAVQWAAARRTIVHALRGTSWDVLHVYQPQVAALADVWHVEYLSRVGVETSSLAAGPGWRPTATRYQQRAVARMEDSYLHRVGGRPTVLFASAAMRDHAARLYGLPLHHGVLHNPAFPQAGHPVMSRSAARKQLNLPADAYVVGYLGGVDERKGYRSLLSAMAELPDDSVLLMAGPRSEGFANHDLGRRLRSVGMLSDTSTFWAAVDCLAAPSRFDPFAMVVTEAAAHGVPVVVTPEVGASDLVATWGAGEVAAADALAPALSVVRRSGRAYAAGSAGLTAAVDATRLGQELLSHWAAAFERNGGARR